MTVQQAFARIRQTGVDKETIYTCYVTGPGNTLLGLVSVKDLLLAEGSDVIEAVMTTQVIRCHTLDDQEDVARTLARYDFAALPVVDNEGRLVGIVTVDDALDVLEEEATEDIEKMAAITPSDKPYLKTSVASLWRRRIPWLLFLMISATSTSFVIGRYESALAANVALTAFIPMLMDTGGNSGSQSSATIIRGLSLGDVGFADFFAVMWKEARVALLCGATLAACNFARLMLLDKVGIAVALTVCITMMITVMFAKLMGGALPLLAHRIGLDPAVMASPLITTVVDTVTLVFYFQVASALLPTI
jgi:magnesium transporter